MILQLPEPLWLLTPDGEFKALFLIDRGSESDDEWMVVNDDGEFRRYRNPDVRLAQNWTENRKRPKAPRR